MLKNHKADFHVLPATITFSEGALMNLYETELRAPRTYTFSLAYYPFDSDW